MIRRKGKDDKFIPKNESSLSMLTRSLKSQHRMESANAVFNNPLLLDKIVKYSIFKSDGKKTDSQTIKTIRLVNKNYLQSAFRILKTSGDWLFELWNCDNADKCIVDKMVQVFSKTCRSTDSIFPISLDINQTYFRTGNINRLRSLLEQCDDIISKFTIEYPPDGESINLNCNNLNFLILQKLDFKFKTSTRTLTSRPLEPVIERLLNGLDFLKCILQNSPNLQRFTYTNDNEAPVMFSSLTLPVKIQEITIHGPLNDHVFNFLTKNQLSNLCKLDLRVYPQSKVHLIYELLKHFQQQLEVLLIDVKSSNESKICIKLPFLERLKVFTLSGENFTLFLNATHVWSKCVPNLNCIVFKTIRKSLFLDLIQGSLFENVRNLKLTREIFVDVPTLSAINGSFANIHALTLTFGLNRTFGKYLFRNFTRLRNLHLNIDYECSNGLPGYEMVSLFLGISFELAIALVDKTVKNVNVPTDNPNSIMNLTELCSLTLNAATSYRDGRRRNLLCSDVIYRYGLEKMPNLQHIDLLGGFEILE